MQKLTLFVALTSVFALSMAAQDKTHKAVFGIEARWDAASISTSQPALNITGIPASARSIPINKDDGGDGIRSLTVPVSTVSLNTAYATGFSVAPQVTLANRITFRGGATFTFYGQQLFSGDGFSRNDFPGEGLDFTTPNFHETNFSGTTLRGVGESLVYYGIKIRPEALPGFFGETELRLSRHIGIEGGFRQSQNRLVLDRGWDRYDAFEDYRQDLFGHLTTVHPYGGITLFFGDRNQAAIAITAGPTQNRCGLESIAGKAICSGKDGLVFGVSLGDRFSFRKTN